VAVKLIMTWDIAPGHEQEYFEFVVREFIPGVQRLGFELSDAWATVYGTQPQILVGATLPSLAKARQMLHSSEWKGLYNQLQDFVINYTEKIIPARGGFQF
jgi:hypothetical protein